MVSLTIAGESSAVGGVALVSAVQNLELEARVYNNVSDFCCSLWNKEPHTVRLRRDQLSVLPHLLGDVGAGLIDCDLKVQRGARSHRLVSLGNLTGYEKKKVRPFPCLVSPIGDLQG